MSGLDEILSNQVLVSAALGWLVAQILKTLIDIWYNKSFSPDRLWGSGGMPSSHSATVCALTTSSALKYGLGDLLGDSLPNVASSAPNRTDDGNDKRCDDETDASVLNHRLSALIVANVDPGLLETDLKAEQCVVVHDDLHCWLAPSFRCLTCLTISKVGGRVPHRVGACALSCGLPVGGRKVTSRPRSPRRGYGPESWGRRC